MLGRRKTLSIWGQEGNRNVAIACDMEFQIQTSASYWIAEVCIMRPLAIDRFPRFCRPDDWFRQSAVSWLPLDFFAKWRQTSCRISE